MQRSFKCCKNKDFTSFFCIVCHGVFHPSCLERLTKRVQIGGCKIYCSQQCQGKALDDEAKEQNFVTEIENLKTELKEKDNYICRLKRNSEVFEDEVSNTEKIFNTELDQQNAKIEQLKTDLRKTKDRNGVLMDKVKSCEDAKNALEVEITKLSNQIIDLSSKNNVLDSNLKSKSSDFANLIMELEEIKTLNKQMISTIHTLENDNAICSSELRKLKEEMCSQNSKATVSPVNDDSPTGKSPTRRPQVLIIGDENVRGFASLIKKFTNRSYDINCQRLDKPSFCDVVRLSNVLSRNFTCTDFIILFWGSHTAIRGERIDGKDLELLKTSACNTNVFLIEPPLYANRPVLNRIIEQQSDVIRRTITAQCNNILFTPIKYITSSGILNYYERSGLVDYICSRYYTSRHGISANLSAPAFAAFQPPRPSLDDPATSVTKHNVHHSDPSLNF